MPRRYREAIALCDLGGLTCDAAADRLGRPVGTIKSQLSRGRALLRQRLARRGVAAPSGPLQITPLPLALARAAASAAGCLRR